MNENEKKKDATGKIFLFCAILLFIVSVVFTGLNVSFMRKCELNYYKTTAVITKLKTEHVNGHSRYRFMYTYTTKDGVEKEVSGKGSMNSTNVDPYKIYVGETVEIYVDTVKNEAIAVDDADLNSVISVVIFAFSTVTYVAGSVLLIHEKGRGLKHRVLITWLPIAVFCVVSVFIFLAGLPHGGFTEIFKSVGGAIGYAVIGAISCVACAVDTIISKNKCDKV